MTPTEEQVFEETKKTTTDILSDFLEHFIDCHTTSEREQELLTLFAKSVTNEINSMEWEDPYDDE